MPNKPRHICNRSGCNKLTEKRYCDEHEELQRIESQKNRVRPTYDRLYNTARWKSVRRRWLLLNPLCVHCHKEGRLTPAQVVDHIKPHKGNLALFWNVHNYQSLCKHCHDTKTAKEDGAFGNPKASTKGEGE